MTATESAVGRVPEELSLEEQFELAGMFAAFAIYTPARTPQRKIEALGKTAADCIRDLRARGLNPADYEFVQLKQPW